MRRCQELYFAFHPAAPDELICRLLYRRDDVFGGTGFGVGARRSEDDNRRRDRYYRQKSHILRFQRFYAIPGQIR